LDPFIWFGRCLGWCRFLLYIHLLLRGGGGGLNDMENLAIGMLVADGVCHITPRGVRYIFALNAQFGILFKSFRYMLRRKLCSLPFKITLVAV